MSFMETHISKCLHFFYNFIFYNLIFELVQQSTKYNLHYASSLKSLKANFFPFKKINLYVNYHISFYSPKYFSMQIFSVRILTVPEPSQHALFLIFPVFFLSPIARVPEWEKKSKITKAKKSQHFLFHVNTAEMHVDEVKQTALKAIDTRILLNRQHKKIPSGTSHPVSNAEWQSNW